MEGSEIKDSSADIGQEVLAKSDTSVQNPDNSERSDGATSPPPNCSICLGKLVNTSFTDSCLHQFCFNCLLEWSKIKTECPLCKQTFNSIIHSVRSEEDYAQYHVPRDLVSQMSPQFDLDFNFEIDSIAWRARRFVYRTTMTGSRRHSMLLNPEQATRGEQLPSMVSQVPRDERRRRRAHPTDYRRTVYRHNVWATPLPDLFGRFRECSADYYRRHPYELDRLIPWVNRDLQVLLNEPHITAFAMSLIMDALNQFDIRSLNFRNILQPFLSTHSEHFAHELLNFAQTNYDLVGYDQSVIYLPRGLSNVYATRIVSPPSSSTSSSNSSIASTDNSDVRILDEAIDLRVNTEIPNTIPHSINMPGPSTIVGPSFHRVEPSSIPELLIVPSSSSESDGECKIVGYVKPRHERTPEIIELSSDSDSHTTSNGNTQSNSKNICSENLSQPSTSYPAIRSSLSSYSTVSSDTNSDNTNSDNTKQNKRNHARKSEKKTVVKYERSYGTENCNKRCKKRVFNFDSSSSENVSKNVMKYNEKRSRKTTYKVQAKGTGIKLIKKEESYSDEDSSNSDSSVETDSKTKITNNKCHRQHKSKRNRSPSVNDNAAKNERTTRNKEKTSILEKLKSKNKVKDQKYNDSRQSRSRSNSESSNDSERDKRSSYRYRKSRNTSEYQEDNASINNKDIPRREHKSKSKKKVYYFKSSDSEDNHSRSNSQCSNHSNRSCLYRKKSKHKEKHKDKEHRKSRIFNLSQSNASTILTMSISSKNDTYPTKHSDRNNSDYKEKHSRKESKYKKSESEKKSKSKKKKRRSRSSSTSNSE